MIGIDEIVFVAQRKGKRSTDGGQHNSVGKTRKEGRERGKIDTYVRRRAVCDQNEVVIEVKSYGA